MKTLLLLLLSFTIVDRVAIAVGNRVITQSEIELRIRLTAFQNGEKPVFDLESRRKAAQMLIDQKLVEREMDVGHYPQSKPSSGQKVNEASLAEYSLTADDLRQDLARQADLLTFLNLRFRAGSAERADADMENWIREQRRQTKIAYLIPELAP